MFSSPFSEPRKQEPGSIVTAGRPTSSSLCRDYAVSNFAMMLATICENEHMPIEKYVKAGKSLINNIFC